MKALFLAASFAASLSTAAIAQSGGSFSIESSTLDSGGGLSTGGSFSLAGTIGQPDAGLITAGSFSLSGGFWVASVIQTPDAPLLSLRLTPGPRAVLTWPDAPSLWQLESSPDLQSWTPVAGQPSLSGGLWSVTTDAHAPRQFFRLMPTATP